MSEHRGKSQPDQPKRGLFQDILAQLEQTDDPLRLGALMERLQTLYEQAEGTEGAAARRQEEQAQKEEQQRLQREHDAHVKAVTSMELPLDWENAFDTDERARGRSAHSIGDGLILSLTTLGKVDIPYISTVTGQTPKAVIEALRGSIYQDPLSWNECFYEGWQTAEEYLSGNLMRKLRSAKRANELYNGYFSENVRALEALLPQPVSREDIYVTLGSPWIPTDIIDDFINHLFRSCTYRFTCHDEITGTWELPHKSSYSFYTASTETFGTPRMEALHILERTLNMKTVAVTDEIHTLTTASGKKRVINQAETLLALEKQQKLIREFQSWVWEGQGRAMRLQEIFESRFGCVRARQFDGSFLEFPTLSPDIRLYPYQKNAVARILFSPNTLLAHDVGSGKTYVMAAAGEELIRMGLSKKNLYVVPNSIVGQWEQIFKTMFPHARLLCVEPKQFTPAKRQAMLEKIRGGAYDHIIMAYSCFEQIPLSRAYHLDKLEAVKAEMEALSKDKRKNTARLKKKRQEVEKEMNSLILSMEHINGIFFDQLGITRLFVDEAHNFKNVPLDAKVDRVLGVSTAGSKKCQDMLDKVRLIQQQNNGGGVVFATGTPITNSVTDVFILQKYLQDGELALLDLQNFDSWIGMFAERTTEFEIDVDTTNYRLATRFAKFHNLPELTALLSSIADFHQVDITDGIPQMDGRTNVVVGKTEDFAEYLKEISHRADQVRSGMVSRTEDNMLKITTDGRKAALDMRLIDPKYPFTYQSKVARCAENVYDIYCRTKDQGSTQLIFCDSSTPKAGFNVYDDLRQLLMLVGVPASQIAFVHDANTETKREKLFRQVRSGQIRILMGSTFKLGLGVNVQDKLIALHHLDVPWRPADMTQQEGRILRQGNENPKVQIFRYITAGSFDAYSWQLLEIKQRFITDLLSGSIRQRSGSDIESTVLDYAEVKALAVGNPLIKERVETANELSRLLALQRKQVDEHIRREKELLELPGLIRHQQELIEACEADRLSASAEAASEDTEMRKMLRRTLFEGVRGNALAPKQRLLMTYRGFDVVLPANMIPERPFVWLCRQGRYYVELGESEVGSLIRLDHFLDNLEQHRLRLEEALDKLTARKEGLEQELRREESYTDRIEACRRALDYIDRKLGVEQHG